MAAATDIATGGSVAVASDVCAIASANLAGVARVSHNAFITVDKMLDNDYMEGHRNISLSQALGAREVQAKVTPGGPQPAVVKAGG